MPDYGFNITLAQPFDTVVARVVAALAEQGFGILSDIDVQKTLETRLGVQRGPYRILGACNPQLANRVLEADPDIGLLLPCNVIVRGEADGRTTVGITDPVVLLRLSDKPGIDAIAAEVRTLMEKTCSRLEQEN